MSSQEYLMQVIVAPHITEKTASVAEEARLHAFKVLPSASKGDVKAAVELMFDVTVENVRVLNVKGKQKRFQQRLGKRSDWKKAYVKLAEGQDIDFGVSE